MDNQVSEEIQILRGAKQEDPISPKLLTARTQEVFRNSQLEEKGINIAGEKLSDLRFADGEAQTAEDVKDIEHQLNTLNEENLTFNLLLVSRYTKEKTNL